MPTATSKDGTAIGYEKTGKGPALLLVNGALSHRKLYGEQELAARLAEHFTVFFYDRRGRGDSTDTKPYTAEREIEDIEALLQVAGGRAYVYGSSSGAALALLAAGKLGPEKILKLALYEPPYGPDSNKQVFAELKQKVQELVAAGKPGDAVTFFLESQGLPADVLEGMKKSTEWRGMERVAHTLVYDFEVLSDGTIPLHIAKNNTLPTLVMDGEKSFDFIHATADTLGKIIPGAVRKTFSDQTHDVSPEVLAPVLINFIVQGK